MFDANIQLKKRERNTNIQEELPNELVNIDFNFQLGKTPGNWDDWYQELVEYKVIMSHTSFLWEKLFFAYDSVLWWIFLLCPFT